MLRFWASMEVYKPASAAAETVRRRVEPFLNAAFAASSLATLEGELRYVPIIMPEDMHARYPERSTLRKRERIYDCAPWLNYEVFANGTFGDQLREYLRGIATSAQQLPGLGATPRQVADFEAIVATAVEDILADWSVRTRHSVAESDTEHVWPISNADMIQVDDCADYKITASELMRTPALPHLSYLRNNGLVFVPFPEREALDHYADRIYLNWLENSDPELWCWRITRTGSTARRILFGVISTARDFDSVTHFHFKMGDSTGRFSSGLRIRRFASASL